MTSLIEKDHTIRGSISNNKYVINIDKGIKIRDSIFK